MLKPQTPAPLARHAMAYVLAGGRGTRLMELTERRVKPAVFFGAKSRIIDFALSNALNSGIRRIGVATQYKAHSLIRHLQRGWNFMRAERNESFDILPASQRVEGSGWYSGTADAVYQNLDIIEAYGVRYMIVLAGDHVYKMDYEVMLQQHEASGADVTVGCIEVPRAEAMAFGVMQVDQEDRIVSFLEKPADPPGMPDKPEMALASMGIYVFSTSFLAEQLRRDAADPQSSHDFGSDLVPHIVRNGRAQAHRFTDSCVTTGEEASSYWRDVGTVDAYWQANIDLCDVVPPLDLYDRDWPIWTHSELSPPAKFVFNDEARRGMAVDSLVSGGCIVSGSHVERSVLSTNVRVHSYCDLNSSVLLPGVTVNRHTRLTRAVVDSGVRLPEGLVVGEDAEADARRFRRTAGGVTLITQPMVDALTA
ncbi:glucose-1-phosphate adenylyltransferase [Pseudoroseomonas deserti]|uniref:Glucose-1-phosphate adenylyltransferase n=1 Tax=Teichococcus deserti TaxID=1817963 RepID=A0A1V2H0Z6_9PROT|nr:glucose-1-phosphate adenylyltransferase [Pseudoroseomonas deserti]ONG51792.1 glucose-1-phosphate adenylyltransferase [Pseudoroseomonas deserti]